MRFQRLFSKEQSCNIRNGGNTTYYKVSPKTNIEDIDLKIYISSTKTKS